MRAEPWFSLSEVRRLEVLKQIMLLFKPTNLDESTKAKFVSEIMMLLGEFGIVSFEDYTRYSDWCRDLVILVKFLFELNHEMFCAGRMQRMWWSVRSEKDTLP